jgi:hypothetical protein
MFYLALGEESAKILCDFSTDGDKSVHTLQKGMLMPSHYQEIDPDLKKLIQLCLHYRRANRHRHNGKRLTTRDVLNEIVELGLERYSKKYHIPLPEQEERCKD